jgi:hypothetical protein
MTAGSEEPTMAGQVVAYGRSEARVQEKGRHEIHASLDPARAELACPLIHTLLERVEIQGPGRTVEMQLAEHQGALVQAAQDAGFELRTRNHRMGILLSYA